eukprot:scaffold12344_cov48-Phaeocystis_antarctica.AAC.1
MLRSNRTTGANQGGFRRARAVGGAWADVQAQLHRGRLCYLHVKMQLLEVLVILHKQIRSRHLNFAH